MADSYRTKIARVVSRLRCLDPEYRDIDLGSFFRDNSGQEDHDELYSALLGSFHVRSLTIGGRERYNNVEYLKLLDSLPCLEKLTIADQCSNEVLHTIKTSIYKSKSIRTVCLKQTSSLKPFLSTILMKSSALRVLSLDDVSKRSNYGPFHDKRAKRSLADAYAANKSLRSLHLGSVGRFSAKLSRCAETFLKEEIICPKLFELYVGASACTGMTIELLRKLLQSTPCLAKLSVDFYEGMYNTDGRPNRLVDTVQPWMDEVLNGLETNQSVTHLRLQYASMDDHDMTGKLGRFLASDSHLMELEMDGCFEVVDPRSLCHLFAGIGYNSHLRSLRILLESSSMASNRRVSDEVPLQLIHALKTNKTLETVTVGMDLSDFGMRAIAEAVPSFSVTDFSLFVDTSSGNLTPFTSNLDQEMGLTALSIRHCSLRGWSLCVGDFLGSNGTLCRLTINCVHTGNLAEIFGALELNTTLEYLKVGLAGATGRASSLRLLCASLPRLQGLRELVMGGTSFQWVTLNQAHRQAFCDNGSLQQVVNDIYYWCREEEDQSFLDFCALRNQRTAFVDGRGDRALWPSILTKLSEKRCTANLSVMQHCLRSRLDWACAGL